MKTITEQFSQEKENYYLQQRDIGNLGKKQVTVSDEDTIYYVDIKNGEIVSVSQPDGDKQFDVGDINSQLKAGATLGGAITGEHKQEKRIQELIKQKVRLYLLS
jgi:sugar lactone lactonase YvrE